MDSFYEKESNYFYGINDYSFGYSDITINNIDAPYEDVVADMNEYWTTRDGFMAHETFDVDGDGTDEDLFFIKSAYDFWRDKITLQNEGSTFPVTDDQVTTVFMLKQSDDGVSIDRIELPAVGDSISIVDNQVTMDGISYKYKGSSFMTLREEKPVPESEPEPEPEPEPESTASVTGLLDLIGGTAADVSSFFGVSYGTGFANFWPVNDIVTVYLDQDRDEMQVQPTDTVNGIDVRIFDQTSYAVDGNLKTGMTYDQLKQVLDPSGVSIEFIEDEYHESEFGDWQARFRYKGVYFTYGWGFGVGHDEPSNIHFISSEF